MQMVSFSEILEEYRKSWYNVDCNIYVIVVVFFLN